MDKPWSVQIELVFGCYRKCDFCYKQVIEKEDYEYMGLDVAEKTAKELSVFDPVRIKFAMRGEPLLHPDIFEIIKIFRNYLPMSKLILTTNGDWLDRDDVELFWENGGNDIIVDCYNNSLEKRVKKFKDLNNIIITNDVKEAPYILDNSKKLYLVKDIVNTETSTRKLYNLAGNVTDKAIEKYNLQHHKHIRKSCTRPFGEMIVFYDGKIGWCCIDGNAEHTLWNVKYGNLKDYWNTNIYLNKIRDNLYHKNRYQSLCDKCNYFGGNPERIKKKKNKKRDNKNN